MGAHTLGGSGSARTHSPAFASVEACLSRRAGWLCKHGALLHACGCWEPHHASVRHQDGSSQPGQGCHRVCRGQARLLFAMHNGQRPRYHLKCSGRVDRAPSFSWHRRGRVDPAILEAGGTWQGLARPPARRGTIPWWGQGCVTGTRSGGCALCVPPAYSQLPLVVSPEEGVRRGSHCEVTAPRVHQDIQLEKEETGKLVTAVGPCCTIRPALSATAGE